MRTVHGRGRCFTVLFGGTGLWGGLLLAGKWPMPGTVTSYSILLELPDELEEERCAFGNAVHAFNETDAVPRGVLFVPLGWEPSVATSSSVIHDDFREIDYFVLILWDRWTSRAHSEYELALQCLASPEYPMRQVVPFFSPHYS